VFNPTATWFAGRRGVSTAGQDAGRLRGARAKGADARTDADRPHGDGAPHWSWLAQSFDCIDAFHFPRVGRCCAALECRGI